MAAHYGAASTSEYFFEQESCFSQPHARKDSMDLCYSPHCKKFFRNFLREQYRTIAAANAEYGTDYKDFAEIEPIELPEAVKRPHLAPLWADFRMAMAASYDNFYKTITGTIQAIQPGARTGGYAECSHGFGSHEAADMWQFSRWTRLSKPYPYFTEQIRAADFAAPGSLMNTGFFGLGVEWRSKEFCAMHPWRDLFQGSNFWYDYLTGLGRGLAHDLSTYPHMQARFEQYREIKSGIGKLIHEARRDPGGAALLYSYASVQHWALSEARGQVDSGSLLYGTVGSRSMYDNTCSWVHILNDVNGAFRFISYEQLASGILSKEKFRLLVLPWSQALSRPEIDAIKTFVKGGGTVLADLRPGVSNEHCKPWETSPLDEVFGVVQDTKAARVRTSPVTVELAGGLFGAMKSDLSLKLASGKAAGSAGKDVPALIRNPYGKGHAILLNFAVDRYFKIGNSFHDCVRTKAAPRMVAFVTRLLRDVPLDRRVRFSPEPKRMRRFLFLSGAIRYVGLVQELPEPLGAYAGGTAAPPAPRKTEVSFDGPAHVYDARNGLYLGFTDSVTAFLTPGVAKVLSLLPYRLDDITVTAPGAVTQGDTVSCQVNLHATAKPEKHVLHIAVVDPEGRKMRHYTSNVNCAGGRTKGAIRLALNERPGVYRLLVRDVASGLEGSATVNVEAVSQ